MLFVYWAIVTLIAVVWVVGVFTVACGLALSIRYP